MAMPGLCFLLWGLNILAVEVAGVVLLALMTRLLPAKMAVTAEAVMEALELPCRPMQQMVLTGSEAVAEEVLDLEILFVPASISPAAKVARAAMDMWRFTVGGDF